MDVTESPSPDFSGVFGTAIRVMTFRASCEELATLATPHLLFGMVATWIVGIGRWWDDPGASLLQHLGIGSVVYVIVLSFVLWLLIKPLGPEHWRYKNVLTFVTLTSPPAILYAIPVERFLDLQTAQTVNVWFLALVAAWRVALLVFYLRRLARLHWGSLIVATLLPLTAIIATLTALNLERAVFDVMGGIREVERTANDAAYSVLIVLTVVSVFAVGPLFIAWLAISTAKFRRRRAQGPHP